MRSTTTFLLLALAAGMSAAQEGLIQSEVLLRFDGNGDKALDLSEMVEYFLAQDPKLGDLRTAGLTDRKLAETAEDWATDAISRECPAIPCPPVPLEGAPIAMSAVRNTELAKNKAAKSRIGWKGLGFKRFVTDPIDPRKGWKTKRPVVFAYLRDGEADTAANERKDQFSFLGGIQLWQKTFEPNVPVPRRYFTLTPGVEMDIDGSKRAFETSLTAALPLSWEWISKGGGGVLDKQTLTVSPKFFTDRAFNREAWEIAADWSFSSVPLGRSGFYSSSIHGLRSPAASHGPQR